MQPPVDADGSRRWLIFCMVSWYHEIGDKEEAQAMELHETLTRLRTERGLSQMELGAQLGMSRQAISKWESGASVPTVENLVAISQWYGVTVDALLEGTAVSRPAENTQEKGGEETVLPPDPAESEKEKEKIRARKWVWLLLLVGFYRTIYISGILTNSRTVSKSFLVLCTFLLLAGWLFSLIVRLLKQIITYFIRKTQMLEKNEKEKNEP